MDGLQGCSTKKSSSAFLTDQGARITKFPYRDRPWEGIKSQFTDLFRLMKQKIEQAKCHEGNLNFPHFSRVLFKRNLTKIL